MYKRDVYDIPMDVGYHTWAYGVRNTYARFDAALCISSLTLQLVSVARGREFEPSPLQ